MKSIQTTYPRVLAIAPGTRGFGYAVIEGQGILVDWGVKAVKGDKNTRCLAKVKEMMARYQPRVMVLENTSAKDSRRSQRIRTLTQRLTALASSRKVKPVLFSRKQIKDVFFPNDGGGAKHTLAENIANRFPEELGFRLPPKRRAWESEDSRMDMFDAVALALMIRLQKNRPADHIPDASNVLGENASV